MLVLVKLVDSDTAQGRAQGSVDSNSGHLNSDSDLLDSDSAFADSYSKVESG